MFVGRADSGRRIVDQCAQMSERRIQLSTVSVEGGEVGAQSQASFGEDSVYRRQRSELCLGAARPGVGWADTAQVVAEHSQ